MGKWRIVSIEAAILFDLFNWRIGPYNPNNYSASVLRKDPHHRHIWDQYKLNTFSGHCKKVSALVIKLQQHKQIPPCELLSKLLSVNQGPPANNIHPKAVDYNPIIRQQEGPAAKKRKQPPLPDLDNYINFRPGGADANEAADPAAQSQPVQGQVRPEHNLDAGEDSSDDSYTKVEVETVELPEEVEPIETNEIESMNNALTTMKISTDGLFGKVCFETDMLCFHAVKDTFDLDGDIQERYLVNVQMPSGTDSESVKIEVSACGHKVVGTVPVAAANYDAYSLLSLCNKSVFTQFIDHMQKGMDAFTMKGNKECPPRTFTVHFEEKLEFGTYSTTSHRMGPKGRFKIVEGGEPGGYTSIQFFVVVQSTGSMIESQAQRSSKRMAKPKSNRSAMASRGRHNRNRTRQQENGRSNHGDNTNEDGDNESFRGDHDSRNGMLIDDIESLDDEDPRTLDFTGDDQNL